MLPWPQLRHCRCDLDLPQHTACDQPIPHPVQRQPPILIAASGGCDLFRMRPPGDRAGQNLHSAPLAARLYAFGSDDDGRCSLAMLVGLDFLRDTTRDPGGWQIPDGYSSLPGGAGLHPPGPGDYAGWAAVLAARPDLAPALGFDDCLAWARRLAADPEGPSTAAAEPALRRMADGLAHRARALRLLGNGVHPLAAAHAWRALAAAHGLGPVDLATDGSGPAPGANVPV